MIKNNTTTKYHCVKQLVIDIICDFKLCNIYGKKCKSAQNEYHWKTILSNIASFRSQIWDAIIDIETKWSRDNSKYPTDILVKYMELNAEYDMLHIFGSDIVCGVFSPIHGVEKFDIEKCKKLYHECYGERLHI